MSVASDAAKVRIVRVGFLEREGPRIIDASSDVTLVEFSGTRIVVDTGSPLDAGLLRAAFRKIKVPLDSVMYIVNTHMHIDHCGCNDLFENARVIAHRLEDPPAGAMRVTERTSLSPNVEIVPTPGHTAGSISVFVSSDRKYVIAGDAIPTRGNFESHTPPSINIDPRLALRSMEMILAWADVVVPGHDSPFEVSAKK
jgi:glyoxylase-like metal-dependent hydrolase (beta-lactamase superfamily II)